MIIQIEVVPSTNGTILINTITNKDVKWTELIGFLELAKHQILDSVHIKSEKNKK